jgi:thiamine-phosphate pyrophosphorylase
LLLYYITDRAQFDGDEKARRRKLLDKIAEAAFAGVNYIQLREKDLATRELELLAREAVRVLSSYALRTEYRQLKTALLINSRTDVAISSGAHGVHLRANDIAAEEVRRIWCKPGRGEGNSQPPIIGISCHTIAGVAQAGEAHADFAVLAPIFEKKSRTKENTQKVQPLGLEVLHEACGYKIPVLALGGVALESAHACMETGAAGIAGIRLFQENKIVDVVQALRG